MFLFSHIRYIKKSNTVRLENGDFENIEDVELKKIQYIFEILPKIQNIHDSYGHISPKKISKILLENDFYMQGSEKVAEQFCKECPECY